MHMVIRAIVYSENEEEALDKAEGVFEGLCGDGKVFDYYTMFMENDNSSVSGKARFGGLPAVARADSPEGKHLIDEGMQFTRDEFMRGIKEVREALAMLTDEELFTEELGPSAIAAKAFIEANGGVFSFAFSPGMVKYMMRKCGGDEGPDVYLYNGEAEGITTPKLLERVLNKWEELYEKRGEANPNVGLEVFVVPADVHH